MSKTNKKQKFRIGKFELAVIIAVAILVAVAIAFSVWGATQTTTAITVECCTEFSNRWYCSSCWPIG